ncbi:uncharacterized protein EI97DRAFT_452230 [Westerdykella ornata]|uniref:Uncharacterized protein n=1 Tax=Westerdykella ornata TaxID=318751 RepID=A0A6A6JAT5_WESOR|nr:uncharacterized protein EI97DRAFT_452230 [Westerdykella ornata]KAF2273720.1 hypothetical protein EI97DRAFT_452230 [Westerdykella ornata]
MVLELHVWGPAFGLPSIDAECLAAVAYMRWAIPVEQWILIADYDVSISPQEFPLLIDGPTRAAGFRDIVAYLKGRAGSDSDLDGHLAAQQKTDENAFIAFFESTASPLLDLYLYVSSENYNATTSAAYTAILPWYLNYTIPPTRRDLARSRTAHLGLSSLDVNTTEQDDSKPASLGGASKIETAKRDAGIPGQTNALRIGRGTGVQGLLGSPIYAARIRLDTLANELLEPVSDLLGSKQYLLAGDKPSSLDSVAFGYLALMFYPSVPQAWLKEAMQRQFPRLVAYIERIRSDVVGRPAVEAKEVWAIATHSGNGLGIQSRLLKSGSKLPWRPIPRRPLSSTLSTAAREIITNLPVLSTILQRRVTVQAADHKTSWEVSSSLPSPFAVGTRAPTASQIQNPPPPPSSTKGGRFFGRGNIGHTFRHKTAAAFGPELAKKLSQLVKMEKNVMRSLELVSRERMEAAQQLSIWGEGCDDDVSDVTDKLGVLIYEIGELEDQFVDRYDQYRVTMKSIRNIEASVQPSRDRKQKITDQIAQLKYKEPNSPKIVVLEQELVRAEAESLVAEAQLSNITREKLKAAFNYQFDALREHCEKLAIIAGYGKHLLELIDDTPVTPGETRNAYDGYEASKAIIQDCEEALTNWVQQNAAVSAKLSTRARTLSQRRRSRAREAEGVDLSGQDQPMGNRESGLWIPASEHQGNGYGEEEEEVTHSVTSENRGREEERAVLA